MGDVWVMVTERSTDLGCRDLPLVSGWWTLDGLRLFESEEKAIEYLFTVSKKQGQVEISQFNAMPEYDFQYHLFRDEENSDETYKYTIEKEKVW